MVTLTLYDLVAQGYYHSLSDISRRTDINRGTINKWCADRAAKVNEKQAVRIAEKARKPLDYKAIAVFQAADRWSPAIKKSSRLTIEFAPRLKSNALSARVMMLSKVNGGE